ncbi:MAG TPA: 3'-5' exonuclease [Enteractinococcus sp.]
MTTAAGILAIPGPDEPWHTGTLLGFDLETTGKNPHTARIVTASIVLLDPQGTVRAHAEWLLDPEVEIPPEAAAVHGVSTEYAREHGMDAAQGLGEIIATLTDFMYHRVPIVAYNGVYDFTVLNAEMARRQLGDFAVAGVVDPYILDKHVDTYRKGKRTLEAVSEHYGVTLDQAHTSLADSVAAVQVAQALVAKFPGHFDVPLETLFNQQIRWKAAQAASFEQFLRRKNPEAAVSRDWPIEKLALPDSAL